MSIINIEDPPEDQPRKALLTAFDGGKTEGNWLSNYPTGTEFLADLKKRITGPDGRIMQKGYNLQAFTIIWKGRKSVRLSVEMPDGSSQMLHVNPILFCQDFDLFEIISMGEEDAAG